MGEISERAGGNGSDHEVAGWKSRKRFGYLPGQMLGGEAKKYVGAGLADGRTIYGGSSENPKATKVGIIKAGVVDRI